MGYLGELMAHLVLDADSQVLGLYPTAALAAAAAPGLPGGVVRLGDVPLVSGAVPGWYVHNNVLQPESPFSAAQTLAMRKQRIVALLRALERIPRIEVWRGADSTGEHRGARADSYGRWVEMQVRAAMVDANYSDVFKYNWMLQEASIPGPTWYWLHKLSDWIAKNTQADRAMWRFFYTTAPLGATNVTPDTRPGIAPPEAQRPALNSADAWVPWLIAA